jgi:HK97 family phage prohead protease
VSDDKDGEIRKWTEAERKLVSWLDDAEAKILADPGDDDGGLRSKAEEVKAKLTALRTLIKRLKGGSGLDEINRNHPGIDRVLGSIDVEAILGEGDKASAVDAAITQANALFLDTFGIAAEEAHALANGIEAHEVTDADPRFVGRFRGYAVEWGSIATPSGGPRTTFRKGAFDPLDVKKVRLYRQHDMTQVPGVILSLRNTDRGLEMEAGFIRTSLGMELAEQVRTGSLRALSVGFVVEKSHPATVPGVGKVRVVDKATLLEVSVVNHGADERALIVEAASKGGTVEAWESDVAAAERWLNGGDTTTPTTKAREHFDWIRGRVLSCEEIDQQRRHAEHERLCRAIVKDPSIAKMMPAALADYVEAIG